MKRIGAERPSSSLQPSVPLMPAWSCPLPGPVLALSNPILGG
jgi:hypothetical protein